MLVGSVTAAAATVTIDMHTKICDVFDYLNITCRASEGGHVKH